MLEECKLEGQINTLFSGQAPIISRCLLYTSDAADDMQCVDLGGRGIIKKNSIKRHFGAVF